MENRHAWEVSPGPAYRCRRCGVLCHQKDGASAVPRVGALRVYVPRTGPRRPGSAWRELESCDAELFRAIHDS
jgi:hypothetical protein